MTATVRRLKINRRYASSACAWCGDVLALGEDGAVCEACETPYHARCWDKENGCNGDPLCVNRPLQQIPDVLPQPLRTTQRTLLPGESVCPSCGDLTDGFCVRCSQMATGLEYTGVKTTSEEAKEALRYAIAGFLCCPIFAVMAFIKATEAKRAIALDPRLGGAGLATTAQVISGIQILWVILWIFGALASA